MTIRSATFAAGVVFSLAVLPAHADVTLPAIISDNMVLQADMSDPIFGKADSGEEVTVEFNGQELTTMAAADGRWIVKLDPVPAGGPYELKVSGNNTLTVKNVLVGEVWLASGQSNMRRTMGSVVDSQNEIAKADLPNFHYFKVPSPDDEDRTVKWVVCSPQTAKPFSGVAYYFARDLQPRLKVPFGIIDNSVSGAVGQQFMSPQAFKDDPKLAELVKVQPAKSSDIFVAEFEPIIPYAIRGALWYQGEGNRNYPVTYRRLLPALIADWRKHWGQGDFPFFIVQLANYQQRKDEPWEGKDCAMREVQAQTVAQVPATALVVTIDCGIAENVHYPNKKPVGERLAVAARALVYGEKVEYSGPVFQAVKFENGRAVVNFTHTGSGLMAKGDKLTGFLLCGADKKFIRAEATIEGDKIVVHADGVPNPFDVRYAWERNPDCNLCNKEVLPASPFRSDNYESIYTRDGAD